MVSSNLNEKCNFSKVTLLRLISKPEYYDLIVMVGDQASNHDELLSN